MDGMQIKMICPKCGITQDYVGEDVRWVCRACGAIMYDDAVMSHTIRRLSDTINSLTATVSLYLRQYPFDDDHRAKQQMMVDSACLMIGKPRTVEEMREMLGEQ